MQVNKSKASSASSVKKPAVSKPNNQSTNRSTVKNSSTLNRTSKVDATERGPNPTKTTSTAGPDKIKLSKEAKENETNTSALTNALHKAYDTPPAIIEPTSNNEPVKGLDAGINTKQFKEAADTAKRNEVNRPNRPGVSPDKTKTDVKTLAEKLRQDGHKLERTKGQTFNSESVRKRGATETEVGPDGKKHVKKGTYVPPSDPKANAYKVEIGDKGLKTDRVFTAENPDDLAKRAKSGGFLAPKGSLDGLTSKEIQEKLALKDRPTHIQDVHTNPGGKKNLSVVGPQPGLGQKGGQGLQFELPERDGKTEFGKVKRLNDLEVHTQRFARDLGKVGKVFKPIGVVTDALDLKQAYEKDGGKIGKETIKTGAGIAGGWGGAVAGAKLGALGGAALGSFVPVVGNVVGGVVGGIVGGVVGAFAGSGFGRWLFS